MISYDPKNWLRVLFDFPRSPVFRTLFFDVLGAGAWAAIVVWVETDLWRVAVPLGPSFLSILGIILGASIGLAVHLLAGFPVSMPWWSFAIGLGFSGSVGVFFGLVPAIRAARLDPIEALRYE